MPEIPHQIDNEDCLGRRSSFRECLYVSGSEGLGGWEVGLRVGEEGIWVGVFCLCLFWKIDCQEDLYGLTMEPKPYCPFIHLHFKAL